MTRIYAIFIFILITFTCFAEDVVNLTLIPGQIVSDEVDLDIRIGIRNLNGHDQNYSISLFFDDYENKDLIFNKSISLAEGCSKKIKTVHSLNGLKGKKRIILNVTCGKKKIQRCKNLEVIDENVRSVRQISGAWAGIYHWSETEGKNWNPALKKVTDSQWKKIVHSMHKLDMNTIVIQEVFRNQEYVGKHDQNIGNYGGKAFYPSKIYKSRMDISAHDPIDAILSAADNYDMDVLIGVGMFAWFDFTEESLQWHKLIAKELWEMYGHHKSFYGFYVSEESGGGLDNWEKNTEARAKRKIEIVNFFREFKSYCDSIAPGKPIMLATNSFDIKNGLDTYPALLENLDILCPFGFARMPKGDFSGKEAAAILQKLCDDAGSHLWFDLEAFLFNEDGSLYPRPIEEIMHDLNLLDNFEKVICYQYPGVFSDPDLPFRIGEERTVQLYKDYQKILNKIKRRTCTVCER